MSAWPWTSMLAPSELMSVPLSVPVQPGYWCRECVVPAALVLRLALAPRTYLSVLHAVASPPLLPFPAAPSRCCVRDGAWTGSASPSRRSSNSHGAASS